MNASVESARAMLDEYAAAVFAKDVDAFMRLYAADVTIFDAWDHWQHEGAEAWRKVVEGWFSSIGNDRVRVTFDDVRVEAGDSAAGVSGTARYAAVDAQGRELRSLRNRFTCVLRAAGDGWVIAHEHTSVPVKFGEKGG